MNERRDSGSVPASSNDEQTLKDLYDRYRHEFGAADLQKYTEIEDGVPLEQVIAEMEQIHQAFQARKG